MSICRKMLFLNFNRDWHLWFEMEKAINGIPFFVFKQKEEQEGQDGPKSIT